MILKNLRIANQNNIIENGYIEIEKNKIKKVGRDYHWEDGSDYNGAFILPGFIDTHIHGIMGADLCNDPKRALDNLSKYLPLEGTTTFCPTTLTVGIEQLNSVMDAVVEFKQNSVGATMAGVHLEGPFINMKYKGAQNDEFIMPPTIETFNKITKGHNDKIAQITYAVEKADLAFTKYIADLNIIPSVGHSDAAFGQVLEHVEYGLNKITHMHNACSPHHHREPGIVTAGFYCDELYAELIADGVHIHTDVLKTTFKIKGRDAIVLITDSLEAKGLEDGEYDMGGVKMIKAGNELRIKSGALAGSIMPMNLCAKMMFDHTDADMMDIVCMTSVNAAKLLKIDDKVSRIEPGYIADLVVLDDKFNVIDTFCRGVKS